MLNLDPITRLTRDLKEAAVTLSPKEARYVVDAYYTMQEYRKATANQVRALNESSEPHEVIDWFLVQAETLEKQIHRALDSWSSGDPIGSWAKGIIGIGPVISAGLLAHIDIEKAPTVGHIWRFAGLDPNTKWEKKQKRPWNADLKTLCWKIGQSFVKVSGNPKSFYGGLYVQRKEYEQKRNEAGVYSEQAIAKLKNFKINKATDAYAWYVGQLTGEAATEIRQAVPARRPALLRQLAGEDGSGTPMLPPAHIQQRSERWAMKLFLSHWHHEAYKNRYGVDPPLPYPIAHMGHVHYLDSQV